MPTGSRKRLRKCPKLSHQIMGGDCDSFSRLPDEVIVSHILPRLTLEEAVRSSVLSRRWQNLWTYNIGSNLIFSRTKDRYMNILMLNQIYYVRNVLSHGIGQVLDKYHKPTLDELTIRCDFDSNWSDEIDNWVGYALTKGARRLELDLTHWRVRIGDPNYTFPTLQKLSALHALCDNVNNLHQPVHCAGLQNLRDVCLVNVDVSSEVIELMLSHCPSLEKLSVWRSLLEKRLVISAQSVKLKILEFAECLYTTIRIAESNIVSLLYKGDREDLQIENVPLLSELSIGDDFCQEFLETQGQNFKYISQLRRLGLHLSDEAFSDSIIEYPPRFPEFCNLRQLEVKVDANVDSFLLWPLALVKAAPVLQKFSFTILSLFDLEENKHTKGFRQLVRKTIKGIHHKFLEVIEFHGFEGNYANELELGKHLLGISQTLKRFVLTPKLPCGRKIPHPMDDFVESVRHYRENAKQLAQWVPSGVEFVVL